MKYKFFKRYIDSSASYKEFQDFLFFEQNYWDDYGFETVFEVYKPDDNGKVEKIGSIGIARLNASLQNGKYIAFNEFDTKKIYEKLPDGFVSIGNSDFYFNLHRFYNKKICKEILQDLNDLCVNYDKKQKNIYYHHYEVVKNSFFRGYSYDNAIRLIEFTLKPLADDGNREGYNITYTYSLNDESLSEINFATDSETAYPQNVHAIIGNNGSGKTTFIKDILLLAIKQKLQVKSNFKKNDERLDISFSSIQDIKIDSPADYFSKVILISFSPFDSMYLKNGLPIGKNGNVKYLGQYQNGNEPLNFNQLFSLFHSLIERLIDNRDNWLFFKEILENQDFDGDILPIVNEIEKQIEKKTTAEEAERAYRKVFWQMSAGQKIILLSIATLITEVEQFNLVLIDEPELFLHPPMISNYIRSISDIMKKKNGLCILTTHSPIIVQEIPRDCVKIIHPNDKGGIKMCEPEYETFGENLSTLTNTIFNLNQYKSGFYRLIKDIINNPEKYNFSKEDIEVLEFGRDGMLYKSLLLSEEYGSGED